MISLESIVLILVIAQIILSLFFIIRSLVIRDNAKKLSDINKIIKEAKISEI